MMKIKLLVVTALLSICSAVFAQDAELIWTEFDNESRISVSEYQDGVWQPAETVVDDGNFNILPAISRNSKGQKLAVWTTVGLQGGSVLKFARRDAGGWQSAQLLTDKFVNNLAPVLLFDAADAPWVFWSANNGDDDDDIYYSTMANGAWSEPQRVHDDNDTPDILPDAGLDENGNIWVSWQQLQDTDYVEQVKSIATGLQPGNRIAKASSINMNDVKVMRMRSNVKDTVPMPEFFESRSRATLHFPNNSKRQSKAIKGNVN